MKLLLSKSQLTAGSVAVSNLSAKKRFRNRNQKSNVVPHGRIEKSWVFYFVEIFWAVGSFVVLLQRFDSRVSEKREQ
ncbi:Protein unc-93 B1, partial [Clarias magur]